MDGYCSLILHAHLPFVRHPEQPTFLEENWLNEAITESYLPLIDVLQGWRRDALNARLTLTLSPTLCSMLLDPLLQERYLRYLEQLIELAEKETHRTRWESGLQMLAKYYLGRFQQARTTYLQHKRDLVGAFRAQQDAGILEIITCAASHAVLPLLQSHPPSLRAQILVARDHYRGCFGRDPRGIWLPECAYVEEVEPALQEANIRWFVLDTHGILYARPRPRFGAFAPVFTPNGLAAFGRDMGSAKQVWSRTEGYPGDFRYRDFYRDIGFDLEYEYLRPYLAAPPHRSFTGIKYYAITGNSAEKRIYDRAIALQVAQEQAHNFLKARIEQIRKVASLMDQPPIIVAPYDAELFGHWWYEGPEFLDSFVRTAVRDQQSVALISPEQYLRQFPTQQVAQPSASSWGEGGYWKIWLNDSNEWIYRHLQEAQHRMTEVARRFAHANGAVERALKQAGRELLLAQSSDWPFILRTGTSPDYARKRVKNHLARFHVLCNALCDGQIDTLWLAQIEAQDNLFPDIQHAYWA